jgi:hypothetical protein
MPSHDGILGSLAHYDLVGFQTENDRDNFERYLVARGAEPIRDGALKVGERRVRLGVFPVGVETATYRRLARAAARSALVHHVRLSLGDSRLVLSVDRIDCSKGILHRMKAFERFLEFSPAWRGKATLLQVTPARDRNDKRFGEIEAELGGMIGRINGRFGDAVWTPIRYVNHPYSRGALAGICRLADVALVTPLRDGMNLVAREYVTLHRWSARSVPASPYGESRIARSFFLARNRLHPPRQAYTERCRLAWARDLTATFLAARNTDLPDRLTSCRQRDETVAVLSLDRKILHSLCVCTRTLRRHRRLRRGLLSFVRREWCRPHHPAPHRDSLRASTPVGQAEGRPEKEVETFEQEMEGG